MSRLLKLTIIEIEKETAHVLIIHLSTSVRLILGYNLLKDNQTKSVKEEPNTAGLYENGNKSHLDRQIRVRNEKLIFFYFSTKTYML